MSTTRDYLEFLNQKIDIAPVNSEEEYQAAGLIESLMHSHGLETRLQDFEAPALENLPYQILGILLFVGVFLAGLLDTAAAVIGAVLLSVSFVLLTLGCLGSFKPFKAIGPKAHSQNVIGVHRGTGPLVVKGERPIVIVAHYDTPRENMLYAQPFSHWQTSLCKYSPQSSCIAFFLGLLQTFAFIPEAARHIFWVLAIIAACPVLIIGIAGIQQLFAPCTEGSNDNKSGVAAMLSVMNTVRSGDDAATGFGKSLAKDEGLKPNPSSLEETTTEETTATEETESGVSSVDANQNTTELRVPSLQESYKDESLNDIHVDTEKKPRQPNEIETEKTTLLTPIDNQIKIESSDSLAQPKIQQNSKNAPANVRHGKEVLTSLHILPDDCEIIYKKTNSDAVYHKNLSVTEPVEESANISSLEKADSDNLSESSEDLNTRGNNQDTNAPHFEQTRAFSKTKAGFTQEFKGLLGRARSAVSSHGQNHRTEKRNNDDIQDEKIEINMSSVSAPKVGKGPVGTENEGHSFPAEKKSNFDQSSFVEATTPSKPSAERAKDDSTIPFVPLDSLNDGQKFDTTTSKDISGLDTLATDSTVIASRKPDKQQVPQMPDDPDWGQSSFKPKISDVSRRAVLFDLPDPAEKETDPFNDDLGSTAHTKRSSEIAANAVEEQQQSYKETVSPLNQESLSSSESLSTAEPTNSVLPVSTIHPLQVDQYGSSKKPRKKKGFFSHKKNKDSETDSISEWLGVDDDYDPKASGREIGTWENFKREEDETGKDKKWKGGATRRSDLRIVDDAAGDDVRVQESLKDSVLQMGDDELLAHDIWFVALGGSYANHAGMKAFLSENRKSIRGAFVINVDCVGSGDLAILSNEGLVGTRRADRRMGHLISQVAEDLHVPLLKKSHDWESTDATPAMQASMRAMTICGLSSEGTMALSQVPDDDPDIIDAAQVHSVAELIAEVIRRS